PLVFDFELGLAARLSSSIGPLSHVLCAEHRAGALEVMALAEQTEIVERTQPAERKRQPALQGQKPPLTAAPAFAVDERALSVVSFPNRPRNLDRHMSRALLELPRFSRLPRAEALAGLFLDQRVESALEHATDVTARERVARELARALELVPELGPGRELDAVPRGRERLDAPWGSSVRFSCPTACSPTPRAPRR